MQNQQEQPSASYPTSGGSSSSGLHSSAANSRQAGSGFSIQKPSLSPAEQDRLNLELWNAAREGDVEVMTRALDKGAQVNYLRDGCDWTPLMIAAYYGHLAAVRTLVDDHQADLNIRGFFRTALTWARCWGHKDVAAFLEQRGAK